MPHIDVNGQRLFYTDSGGDKPVLLFSHGLHMDHEMFAPQIERLRADYRCIAWDERGHGATGAAMAEFSYYDSAADAAGLLEALGVDSAVWVGMSQGGYLSLRAALTYPDKIRALVLIDTQARPEPAERIDTHQKTLAAWREHGLTDAMADNTALRILGEGFADTDAWKAKWRQFTADNVYFLYNALDTRDDVSDRLGEIDVPALVIHGEADRAITLERAQDMAARLTQSELVVIEGAGHAANLTHPDAVNPPLVAFLAKITTG
ncbi:alpha/beta fold hydrolase [Salinisphaera aquimarina]|uniref:Alpha/beta fold hydrolase n=1 Tax=Salinisphaera aquimarina TaxID=2094031 RepID=A0ABV7EPT4_9GAMM